MELHPPVHLFPEVAKPDLFEWAELFKTAGRLDGQVYTIQGDEIASLCRAYIERSSFEDRALAAEAENWGLTREVEELELQIQEHETTISELKLQIAKLENK